MIFLWVLGMGMIFLGGHLCAKGYFARDEAMALGGLMLTAVGGILAGTACGVGL